MAGLVPGLAVDMKLRATCVMLLYVPWWQRTWSCVVQCCSVVGVAGGVKGRG
jgi:hypothetical protein